MYFGNFKQHFLVHKCIQKIKIKKKAFTKFEFFKKKIISKILKKYSGTQLCIGIYFSNLLVGFC